MSFLASDVMDQSAVILNDVAKTNYTYAAMLPLLQKANQELEQQLIIYGASPVRLASPAITVLANAVSLTLPVDFLLPLRLFERLNSSEQWQPMEEKRWNPESYTPTTSLTYWAFYNNLINFPGATVGREVLLEYQRRLLVISTSGSTEDFYLTLSFLAARTAELCARYIGMNTTVADGIRDNDVFKAEDALFRVLVLNGQGVGARRRKFNSKRIN